MRFNYTYSQFNYHLIGVNVANFDKIRRTISEISGIKKNKFPIWESRIHNNVIFYAQIYAWIYEFGMHFLFFLT